MSDARVEFHDPLFARLRQLDAEARARSHTRFDAGLGSAGLILSNDLGEIRYFCTPVNCTSFADTGADGVHFSFLLYPTIPTDQSPVVVTIPAGLGGVTYVVGQSLFDFLCLGMLRGFRVFDELAYDQETALIALTDPKWQPTGRWNSSLRLTRQGEAALRLLTRELGLHAWSNPDRFHSLQNRFAPFLEYPPGYLEG